MKAYLTVPESMREVYPTIGDLNDCLSKHGIVHGIRQDVVAYMAAGRICGERVLVAQGEAPKEGRPGTLEFLIDTSLRGRPRESADGSVDMRNLGLVINVSKGQPLARKIAPVPGGAGRSVFGERIDPPVPPEAEFRNGAGTKVSDEDADVLVAAMDGAMVVAPDGLVEVVKSEIIRNDIDYTTGNVTFKGDLTIRGSVRAGFTVAADGNLRIGGNVEETQVVSTGNMDVAGGAAGCGEGSLVCGGTLRTRHVERFNVKAGRDVFIAEDAIHSTIVAQGRVKVKNIVGGTVSAGESIEAETVGAAAETRTVLDAGGTVIVMLEKQELQKDIGILNQELGRVRTAQYDLVRDAMDEKGKMSIDDERVLDELWTERTRLEQRRRALYQKVEGLDARLRDKPPSMIKVAKALPNTLVRFGHIGKLIKSTLLNVVFTLEDERIKIAKVMEQRG